MKTAAVRSLLIIGSFIVAYYVAIYFGMAYGSAFPKSLGGGSMIPIAATEWFAGLPLAMIFLIVFSLNFAGGRNKWWWIIIPLLPAILFEIFIDPLHIYIPIILGLIAWGLGTMANKTLRKLAPSYMAKIAQKR